MIRRVKEKFVLQYDSTISFFADALQRMRTHEGFKRYFKNTGWLFGGKIFGLITSFFVSAYVARYLGPDLYGVLNYVTGFVGLFAILASFGIDSILVRELVMHPEKRDILLGTGILVKFIGGAISVVLVLVSSSILNADISMQLLMVIFSITFIFQAFNIIDLYLQAKVFSKNIVLVQIFTVFVSSLLKVSVVLLGGGVMWFLLLYVIDAIMLAIGFIWVYFRFESSLVLWKFDRKIALQLLSSSWPLVLSGAAGAIYMKIDQVMIKHIMDNRAAGIYAAAVKLSEIWYFFPGIICSSVFPAIINAKKISDILYRARVKKLYLVMIGVSTIIALFSMLFAHSIVLALFGPSYIGAVGTLKVYIWSSIAVFLGTAIAQNLLIKNKTKLLFWGSFAGALSNIALNLFFIPSYGIIGAAIATLISYAIVDAVLLYCDNI